MSNWKVEIGVVAEEHLDEITETLRRAQEDGGLNFPFSSTKSGRDPANASETIQQYFCRKLGEFRRNGDIEDYDIINGQWPLDCVCGQDCAYVIDATRTFCLKRVECFGIVGNARPAPIFGTMIEECWEMCECINNG